MIPENPDPEDPGGAGGAHDEMMRWMVKRVPTLPPEPRARQIAEHELTGHALYRSWCRHNVASNGRAHAHASREEGELPEIGIECGFLGRDREDVSNAETVQLDAWERQLLTGRVRQTTRVHFRQHASRVWDSREFW